MKTHRLIIIDDHELLRRGFIAALDKAWSVAGQASALAEAKTLFAGLPEAPDLVALDIALPGGEWGLELLLWLEARYGRAAPPVLVYSAFADYGHIQIALAMGARGYVSKDEGFPVLEKAMLALVSGKTFVNQDLYSHFPFSPELYNALSRQEKQVLVLAQKGWDDRRIGAELLISRRTVEWYLHCIYDKLGVKSRRALLALKPGN
jgi:DNA-binding NarL/FixJ family response regulator